MDELEDQRPTFYKKVVVAVREQLYKKSWFRGVCLDGIEPFEKANDLDGAIEHAINETIYWDRNGTL